MGILGLNKLIADIAPTAIRDAELKSYFGRRIAIDASMSLYQFLIAIRQSDQMMTNSSGETTSHIVGFFYRTCKLLEAGIKPVYVFDGKPPVLKGDTLGKRMEAREKAKKDLEVAKEEGNEQEVQKLNKRLVRVTKSHNDDVKTLLRLMGLPVIESPSEAEAQCAQLAKEGLVYAVATEDMDALTFGAPRVIRHLSTGASGDKDKVKELDYSKVLSGLELTHEQFVDLCILMGCDYCGSIKGVGGKKGLDLIRKYNSIEKILTEKYDIHDFVDVQVTYGNREEVKEESTNGNGTSGGDAEIKEEDIVHEKNNDDSKEAEDVQEVSDDSSDSNDRPSKSKKSKKTKTDPKTLVPENWLFKGARLLFTQPKVDVGKYNENDLKVKDADEEKVLDFLVNQHGFSEERVKAGLNRIKAFKQKSSQSRIDSFFRPMVKTGGKEGQKKSSSGKSTSAKATGKKGKK